jgi:hypothetical protein
VKTAHNPVSHAQPDPDPRVSNHIPITHHLSKSVPPKRKHPAATPSPSAPLIQRPKPRGWVVGGSGETPSQTRGHEVGSLGLRRSKPRPHQEPRSPGAQERLGAGPAGADFQPLSPAPHARASPLLPTTTDWADSGISHPTRTAPARPRPRWRAVFSFPARIQTPGEMISRQPSAPEMANGLISGVCCEKGRSSAGGRGP